MRNSCKEWQKVHMEYQLCIFLSYIIVYRNKNRRIHYFMARFTNQAQLRYGNAIANSNIAVGEILEVLSATKTAVRKNYGRNDTITYLVSVVNAGNTALTGLTLTDNLGAYVYDTQTLVPLRYIDGTVKYYSNGTLQAAPAVTAGPPLVISGLTVPANGSILIAYETDVNEYAPLDVEAEIVNTATIRGTGITPVTVQETVSAGSEPILTITKSISPVPVTENGTLTYTFLIQNTGNVAVEEAAASVVTDQFNPILSNLTVIFNGTAWAETTNYIYNEDTGLFSTVPGQITVPAATFAQDELTGAWNVTPGVSTLVITGTI